MTFSDTIQLTEIKEFVDKGKFYEALQILNNLKSKENHRLEENPTYNLLKCICLSRLGQDEEALKLADFIYQASEKSNDILGMLKSSMLIAETLAWLGRQEKALETIMKSEILLKKSLYLKSEEKDMIESSICNIKTIIYIRNGELDLALNNIKRSLSLREKYNNTEEKARFLYIYGNLLAWKGEFTRGLEYLKEALSLEKDGFNRYITRIYLGLGTIKGYQGDQDQALDYYERGLEIATKMECKRDIAGCLNNIGCVYHAKGELYRAEEYLNRSLQILKKLNALSVIAVVLGTLLEVSLDLGEIKQAQKYLRRIQQINDREANEAINVIYREAKALMLKANPRAKNIAKAEQILKQIIEEECVSSEATVIALIHLCDLCLIELKNTCNLEILDEIQPYINQLLDLAEKNFSYYLLGETYLLQAKLALLTLDIKKARRLLTQTKQIAKRWDLKQLAKRTSKEEELLIKELSLWDKIKRFDITLTERMENFRIDIQIEEMIRNRVSLMPKVTEKWISVQKERKICVDCKTDLGGYMFICPECNNLYCENCAKVLADLENMCWICNSPIDPKKPVKPYDEEIKILSEKDNKLLTN